LTLRDNKTLVILATLNEEKGIGPTLTEVNHFLEKPPCLIVDGHSKDCTIEIAKSFGAHVLFQKNEGKGDAIATAIKHITNIDVCYVAFIDADYTYPAEYLPKMIHILQSNRNIGMVCGNRFNKQMQRGAMAKTFYFGNSVLTFTHNLLNGVQLKDPLTGLRVIRWEILKDWDPKSKGFDIEVELNNLVENRGFKIVEIPIHYRQRIGEKKLKFMHGVTILKRILTDTLPYNYKT
jgi:glycosyltransferase involved in cell wall biosynthesis